MDYEVVARETVAKSKRSDGGNHWNEILTGLTWDKAIRIPCPDVKTLRAYQPRIYEASLRCHKLVETFKTTENGQIFLNVWLRGNQERI